MPQSQIAAKVPHALSLLRIALAPVYVAALSSVGSGASLADASFEISAAGASAHAATSLAPFVGTPFDGLFVAAIAATAAATDFADGRLARRFGSASSRGAALDIVADAVFVLCALGALASRDVIPWLHPMRGGCASGVLARTARPRFPRGLDFAGSRAESRAREGSGHDTPPRALADRVGHAAGIANYAIILLASAGVAWLTSALALALVPWLWTASTAVALLNLAPLPLRRLSR